MKTTVVKVGEFDVAITFYSQNIMVIIHDSIPGVGSIILAERDGESIECDWLIGQANEMLGLLATKLAEQFGASSVTFVMAFRPSRIERFEDIKAFVDAFGEVVKSQ